MIPISSGKRFKPKWLGEKIGGSCQEKSVDCGKRKYCFFFLRVPRSWIVISTENSLSMLTRRGQNIFEKPDIM